MNLKKYSLKEFEEQINFYYYEASKNNLDELYNEAEILKNKYYGKDIYLRALIEFTTYCKNECYYCGLNCKNDKAIRYRLSNKNILDSCKKSYNLGYKTFVLQGGEDSYYKDEIITDLVYSIKTEMPDSAVTLSIGEKAKSSYKMYFDAGADRFLLRHETADEKHYQKLHAANLSHKNRMKCLYNLKDIGYQTGAGFMVDSPYQTIETLAEDMMFLSDLQPEMVGIGPFIPHMDTRFKNYYIPDVKHTLILLAMIRKALPKVLLPATTALATIDKKSRSEAFKAGANVLMPNASPICHRKDYALYDGKENSNLEAVENTGKLIEYINKLGSHVKLSRGDHVDFR